MRRMVMVTLVGMASMAAAYTPTNWLPGNPRGRTLDDRSGRHSQGRRQVTPGTASGTSSYKPRPLYCRNELLQHRLSSAIPSP
jgi:hypothetical protein